MSYRKYGSETLNGVKKKIAGSGQLHHRSFSIITEYDWITQVDYQTGLVQKILCDKEEKAHQNACHLLEGTICHLLQHCGDKHARFDDCSWSFDLSTVYPSMISFVLNHRYIFFPCLLVVPIVISLAIIPELV